jgi:hypothetical protein
MGAAGVMAVLLLGSTGGPKLSATVSLFQVLGYNLLVVSAVLILRVLVMISGRHGDGSMLVISRRHGHGRLSAARLGRSDPGSHSRRSPEVPSLSGSRRPNQASISLGRRCRG